MAPAEIKERSLFILLSVQKRSTIFSRHKFINIINILPFSGVIKVELSITEAVIQD